MARAARLVDHGEPLVVEEVEIRAPQPDEVLVDMAFAGVNPIDRSVAQGRVAPDVPLPRTLGSEGSGTIDGKPVVVIGGGLGAQRDGLWANAAVVPQTSVVPLPEGFALADAAIVGIAGLTAWNVLKLAELEAGEKVLVLGSSGGVGLAIVSLAASAGATVWGQTTSPDKVDAVSRQGAAHVVVSDAQRLVEAVGELEPSLVFDSLGGDYTQAGLASLQPQGRLVIFGAIAGPEGLVQLQALYRNGLRVIGYAGLRLTDEERRTGLAEVFAAMAAGRMSIPIDRILPLEEVNTSFDLLSSRAVTGKIVLDLG